MMTLRFIVALCLSAFSTSAASWYLDGELGTGSNAGTSWADAWRNPTNVVWASISAGDTLYISGGTTSKVYTNQLYMSSGKSGTAGNYITVRVGQDAGHNGVAIFDGVGLGPSGSSRYVWFNGARSDSFVAPTNHQQVLEGTTAITNNIGFWIRNIVDTNGTQDTDPVVWQTSVSPKDTRLSYIEVSGLTNTFATGDWKGTVFYINGDGTTPTNVVMEYLYLHNNVSQQFASGSHTTAGFDEIVFKFGAILEGGEDHFEIAGGWTIRDSIIGQVKPYAKSHADLFQMTGNFIKIYNNDIRESANAVFRLQSLAAGTPLDCIRSDIWIFNNLITEKLGRAQNGGTYNEPGTVVNFDPDHNANLVTYSNIVIANNLWYNTVSNTTPGLSGAPLLSSGAAWGWSVGSPVDVTNVVMVDCIFVNNLFVDKHRGVGASPATTNFTTATWVWPYTTNDFFCDYNTVAATNANYTTPWRLFYMDMDVLAGTNNTFKFSNNTNYPAFTDKENDNFELLGNDTVALNTGYNLSTFFNFDALNRPRNISAAWDRGPLEYQDTNLIVWITFEEDWSTTNRITDYSGYGNHAWRKGNTAFPNSTTNWPARVLASTVPGVNSNGYAGQFSWTTNSSYSFYNREGTYAVLTNAPMLTNLTQVTISVWAKYDSTYGGGDYLGAATATLISAGGGAAGKESSWNFGRNSSPQTRFCVLTNVSGSSTRDFNFPDKPTNESGWDGNTTNWHHYVAVWSNGVINLYFDGTNCNTGDVSGTTTALNIGMNGGEAPYLSLGVNTHGGDWDLNDAVDDYPNNGWLTGYIDGVKIWSRVLTAAEVLSEYQGNASAGGSSGGGEGGGGSSTFTRSVRTGKQSVSGKVIWQ